MTLSDAWIAATGIAICAIVPFLILRMHAQTADSLSIIVHRAAHTAVRAVEQQYPTSPGEFKKQRATKIVDDYLDSRKIKFPDDKTSAIIEAEVYTLNHS